MMRPCKNCGGSGVLLHGQKGFGGAWVYRYEGLRLVRVPDTFSFTTNSTSEDQFEPCPDCRKTEAAA